MSLPPGTTQRMIDQSIEDDLVCSVCGEYPPLKDDHMCGECRYECDLQDDAFDDVLEDEEDDEQ